MQGFLFKICAWILLGLGLHAWAGTKAGGTTDEYYLRFTTPKQHALILGGSRASRGLHPDVLDSALTRSGLEGPLYNFSFTIDHSPYGQTYLTAIRAKLDPRTVNGLFILEVSPWLLVQPKSADSVVAFPEAQRLLGEQWFFNMRPNYEYLIRHRTRGWGSLLRTRPGWAAVRSDGRLFVRWETETERATQTAARIEEYRDDRSLNMDYSLERERTLADLINELKPHGRVVLVRLPCVKALKTYDDMVCPDFLERMNALAIRTNSEFIDLMPLDGRVHYVDGSHLDDRSGVWVSRALADSILARLP